MSSTSRSASTTSSSHCRICLKRCESSLMDSPLHDVDDRAFADPHAGYEPVARHLKVLSAPGLAAASLYFLPLHPMRRGFQPKCVRPWVVGGGVKLSKIRGMWRRLPVRSLRANPYEADSTVLSPRPGQRMLPVWPSD